MWRGDKRPRDGVYSSSVATNSDLHRARVELGALRLRGVTRARVSFSPEEPLPSRSLGSAAGGADSHHRQPQALQTGAALPATERAVGGWLHLLPACPNLCQ